MLSVRNMCRVCVCCTGGLKSTLPIGTTQARRLCHQELTGETPMPPKTHRRDAYATKSSQARRLCHQELTGETPMVHKKRPRHKIRGRSWRTVVVFVQADTHGRYHEPLRLIIRPPVVLYSSVDRRVHSSLFCTSCHCYLSVSSRSMTGVFLSPFFSAAAVASTSAMRLSLKTSVGILPLSYSLRTRF